MTRARFPDAFSRSRSGPLQVTVPSRLPGGLWGPPPIGGTVSFDPNGFPLDPATGGPQPIVLISLAETSRSLLQTDWPIPTRWELQFGLSLTCITGGFSTWPGAVGTFALTGAITGSVESSSVTQVFSLVNGPGAYPFQAAVSGVSGLGSTFPIVAQQVRVQADSITLASDPALQTLAGSTWAYSFSALAGLTSPAVF